MAVQHDLSELKLCMYMAISRSLDRCTLPPEKLSVALAVAIDEYLPEIDYLSRPSDETGFACFVPELLRCMEQHTEGITATMKNNPRRRH